MRIKVALLCFAFLALAGCLGGGESDAQTSPQDPPPEALLAYPGAGSSYKVAFVGNSITHHGPSEQIGWHGDWGMAASNGQADYVHQLEDVFQHYNAEMVYQLSAGSGPWERDYASYDLEQMRPIQNFNADIIIIRLGENVPRDDINDEFRNHLKRLVQYIDGDQPSFIIMTDTFIPSPTMNEAIKATAEQENYTFCRISDLFDNIENTAIGQFENDGVAQHPSDQGMYQISQRLFGCMQEAGVF